MLSEKFPVGNKKTPNSTSSIRGMAGWDLSAQKSLMESLTQRSNPVLAPILAAFGCKGDSTAKGLCLAPQRPNPAAVVENFWLFLKKGLL